MHRLDINPLFCLVRHPESNANVHLHKLKQSSCDDEEGVRETLNLYGDPDITAHIGVEQAKHTATHLYKQLHCKGTPQRPIRICVFRSNMKRTERLMREFVALCETSDSIVVVSTRVDENMQEYTSMEKDTTFPKDANSYVFTQRVYEFYQKEIVEHCNDKTVDVYILFGHSMFFSMCLNFIVCDEFYPFTTKNLCSNENPSDTPSSCQPCLFTAKQRMKTVFHLPNCSITNFAYNTNAKCWNIYNFASIGHLASFPELQTGTHCVTQK